MKSSLKSFLVLAAFAPFGLASCSEKTQDNAEATAESAANDAANATDAAGNAIENTADNAAAEMAPEPGDTAVVQNRTTDGMVEEMPAQK